VAGLSDRDVLIQEIAALISGLAVPVSVNMPIGAALAPWSALHSRLIGFGWGTAEQYEAALREVLDAVPAGHDGPGTS
jgi:hypothetical protein